MATDFFSQRTVVVLALTALIGVYVITIIGQTNVKDAEIATLAATEEGEWRNVCGIVKRIQIRETVAFISFENTSVEVTLFKDVYEKVHVNDVREHDLLCLVGYIDSHQGKKTLIGRRLGYLIE